MKNITPLKLIKLKKDIEMNNKLFRFNATNTQLIEHKQKVSYLNECIKNIEGQQSKSQSAFLLKSTINLKNNLEDAIKAELANIRKNEEIVNKWQGELSKDYLSLQKIQKRIDKYELDQ